MKNLLILLVIAGVGLGAWYVTQRSAEGDERSMHESDTMMEDSKMMMESSSSTDMMMTEATDTMMKDAEYTGAVVAAGPSPIIEFNEQDYARAQESGTPILLWFYANWCPNCQTEQASLIEAVTSFKEKGLVIFRVNFNDSDTDATEKGLAKQYQVAYQHTKVLVVDGELQSKSPEVWDTARATQELSNIVTKY